MRLRAGAPTPILRKLLLGDCWSTTLECLSLCEIPCVDDVLLAEILGSLPRLRCVDVSQCAGLRAASLRLLRSSKLQSWAAEGCWRMLRPCPALSPETVLRAQYTALQQNGDVTYGWLEGVGAAFEFAAPSNRTQTGPLRRFAQMIHMGYPVMLDASAAVSAERLPAGALHAQLGHDDE